MSEVAGDGGPPRGRPDTGFGLFFFFFFFFFFIILYVIYIIYIYAHTHKLFPLSFSEVDQYSLPGLCLFFFFPLEGGRPDV